MQDSVGRQVDTADGEDGVWHGLDGFTNLGRQGELRRVAAFNDDLNTAAIGVMRAILAVNRRRHQPQDGHQ